MSKKTKASDGNVESPKANGAAPEEQDLHVLPFTVNGQYIKDLSFEHPSPFRSSSQESPSINLNINVQATPLEGQQFEVDLQINAEAVRGSDRAFLLELVYSGAFTLNNVPQEYIAPVLLIECPRLLFPFARNIVADITRDGGFPPLILAPVDFAAIYRQQLAQSKQ